MRIFIQGNVPSLKNSKQWTGKFLISSKTVQKYIKEHKNEYLSFTKQVVEYLKTKTPPYKISFTFLRGSRHKFDYINAAQLPLDLMVDYGWIEDDNADVVIPVFEPYEYDKNSPGVIIEIL